MKFALEAMAISAIVWGLAAPSFAIPYASQIQAKDTTVAPGSGTQISYFLNEAADTVTVSLTDHGTTVAQFAGPAARGRNVADWNGTQNNAAGAPVTNSDLQITVSAAKSHSAWTEISGNRSAEMLPPAGTAYQQLYTGFTPNDCLFVTNPASDFFGLGFADVSNTSPSVAAAISINSDTSTLDSSDGLQSRVFRAQQLEATAQSGTLWGMCADPDNADVFFFTGQASGSGNKFWRGDVASSATLTPADPENFLAAFSPRAVKLAREGNFKYAYFCSSTDIYKAPMDTATNSLSGAPVRVTSFAKPNRYARGVDLDAAGNLYFVSKHTGDGEGGILLRWDAEDVAGPTPLVKEVNAAWTVEYPDTMINMMGPAISPQGDVYVAMISGGEPGKQTGIYSVGNSQLDSLTKTLSASDCVVDFSAVGDPATTWQASTLYFNLRCDPMGNLVAIDRATQQLRLFSPPGNFNVSITAPTSQTIRPGAGIGEWAIY